MQGVGGTRGEAPRGKRVAGVAVATVALLALAACTSNSPGGDTRQSPAGHDRAISGTGSTVVTPSASSSAAAAPAVITTSPPSGAHGVNPRTPVTVKVAEGKLTSVKLVNPYGKRVSGQLSADGTSWHSTEVLGYDRTYKLTAKGQNADGVATVKHARLTTVSPSNQTTPTLERIGGYALGDNQTYGVAIVPVVHFDEPITDERAAEKALTVTTTPHVDGSWYWADNQNVHFRPRHFWPSGTKVTISAKVYGVDLGSGLYGSTDATGSFTVGVKQVTIADDNAPKVNKVRVYRDGTLLRTMNTSMGQHTGVTVGGQYINFYTMDGTYTVLEHDNPAIMSSQSYGLPANSPYGYGPEPIYYSTKISTDGIYLHELDNTVWDQDNGYDVSHGCLNLNRDNAIWYYHHSHIGDPVIVHGAKGAPEINIWQGGDWSIPWKTWVNGSAVS
jgi:lipoprotein-anchoring transpeptidase ErfK/SrfK